MKPIDRLIEIMALLRDKEKGCPWDVEQNYASIAPHTIEEAYEVADAIERGDMKSLREELGDLLLQVVFHAQMATEEKTFTFDDVAQAICEKLVTRHPHVFGNETIKTAADQEVAWEKQKAKERQEKADSITAGNPLEGVSLALPGLTRALKLQKRAATVGFDWVNIDDIFSKLNEEVQELIAVIATEKPQEAILEEVGDMIFCCVNIARRLRVDPEEAVRFCNRKFENRIEYMRKMLDMEQRDLSSASFQELNDLWDEAKIAEKAHPESLNPLKKTS